MAYRREGHNLSEGLILLLQPLTMYGTFWTSETETYESNKKFLKTKVQFKITVRRFV